ncbi:MAG: hypothetical protein QOG55_2047 [Acidobacteriaceae bacterium]|nr:hypothetical protein [Acidobacteriaceae bacterium]
MHGFKKFSRFDAALQQFVNQLVSRHWKLFFAHDAVHPVTILHRRALDRQTQSGNAGQSLRIKRGITATHANIFVHSFELGAPERGVKILHSIVVTNLFVNIFTTLTEWKAEVFQIAQTIIQ